MTLLLLAAAGCNLIKLGAVVLPPPTVEAQYTRFAGQTIAVVVWADLGIRIDWPMLQLDLCNALQNRLKTQVGPKKPFEGATFPYSAQQIIRFQEDYPELEFSPVEEMAVRLNVSRVIYVEVNDFSTRADSAGELFRGSAVANLKVVEVDGGKGVMAYEEQDIEVSFPPKVPPEGTLKGNDSLMYSGTIQTLADRIKDRFVPYEMDK